MNNYRQGEIYLAGLDPTHGSEQTGTRPVVVISSNTFNESARLVIVVPLTTQLKYYFGSVIIEPSSENGLTEVSEAMSSHVRSISNERLKKRLGSLTPAQVTQLHYKLHLLLTI